MIVSKRIGLACIVVAVVVLAAFLPLESWHVAFVDWSEHHPILAVLAFSGLVVLGMVVMLPVSIQAMTAGFLFGLTKGFAIMCLAGLTGFTAAFLVGRSLARPWVAKWAKRRPEFAAIDQAMSERGLALVILARLSQVLPYNLLNYSFGLTSVGLRDYIVGSAVGMLPGIFMFVFIGTTATDIAAIVNGELELGGLELWIGGVGLLLVAAAVVLITRFARRSLKEQLKNPEKQNSIAPRLLDS